MQRSKIVNFCPTGTQQTRSNSLAPLAANEIIDETIGAYQEELITVVHIHARDPHTFENSWKPEHYQPIIEGIRKYCPDLSICVSLTGRYFNELEKRSAVLELKPDMGSLTMSSLNFPTGASINSPEMILSLIEKMKQFGVIPELECFDTGMLNYTKHLIHKGILEPPYYINVIFGNLFNAQISYHSISDVLGSIPHTDAKFCFGGIGRYQQVSAIHGLTHANGARIGLEDNLYLWEKEDNTKIDLQKKPAKNIDLLRALYRKMLDYNFEVMPPKQFQQLGFKNKNT